MLGNQGLFVPLFFAVPVWGEAYVDVFVRTGLAAQLAPNNLPALPHLRDCCYNIYTTHPDVDRLRTSPAFERLASLVKTNIHFIDTSTDGIGDFITSSNRYETKSECYRHSMLQAAKARAANVLLNADIVLCDGFLSRTVKILASGKRVLEVVGPRALKLPVETILQERFRDADGIAIAVSPRQLATIWVDHIHPMSSIHFWEGSASAPFHPSHLYWRVSRHSILVRCFHIYPIVFFPRNPAEFHTTIDDDLVARTCPDLRDTYVATDSDDLFCLELSDEGHSVGTPGERGNIGSTINFYRSYGLARNFKLLRYRIRIAGADEEALAWKQAFRKSDRIVFRIYCEAFLRLPWQLLLRCLRRAAHRARCWVARSFAPPR